jgi:hypothetical protein
MNLETARRSALAITESMVFPRKPWDRYDRPAGQHWSDSLVARLALGVGDNTIIYSTGYLEKNPEDPLGFVGKIIIFTEATIVRVVIDARRPETSDKLDVTAPVTVVPSSALERIEIVSVDAIPDRTEGEEPLGDWLDFVSARAHIGGETVDLPLIGGHAPRRDAALAPFLMQAFAVERRQSA